MTQYATEKKSKEQNSVICSTARRHGRRATRQCTTKPCQPHTTYGLGPLYCWSSSREAPRHRDGPVPQQRHMLSSTRRTEQDHSVNNSSVDKAVSTTTGRVITMDTRTKTDTCTVLSNHSKTTRNTTSVSIHRLLRRLGIR